MTTVSSEALACLSDLSCASCGGRTSFPIAQHGKWTYFQCKSCRSLELFPMPTEEELHAYYNSSYKVPFEAYHKTFQRVSSSLLSAIETFAPRSTLLEIGCSHGTFLLAAQTAGWDVAGIEISDPAAENARAHGLRVFTGTLERVGAKLPTFDCIVAWHVIEHIVDVGAFLEAIRERVRPGGIVALRTPNAASLVAKIIPQYWQWIYPPAHVRLFSLSGLRQLLERYGLRVVYQRTSRGDARTLGTDLLMAVAKACMVRKAEQFNGTSSQENASRGGKLSQYTDSVFAPLDWLLGLNGRNMRGADLFVIASATL
jgi:2-polyprenyl-3-methyl-5-hydroxy-6-metoxy-1,4-benzoquinol methylase